MKPVAATLGGFSARELPKGGPRATKDILGSLPHSGRVLGQEATPKGPKTLQGIARRRPMTMMG